jgi:Rieske Fe-S protein
MAERWREDFPVEWERDRYVTRRELAKFLTLGSIFLAGASAAIAVAGSLRRVAHAVRVRVARASVVPRGGSVLFTYPTRSDPCILVRGRDGQLNAFSQVCTHLSCAVVYRPGEGDLFCPCHHGVFSAENGRPLAGPPTRPLPRILLEEDGDEVYATGKEPAS